MCRATATSTATTAIASRESPSRTGRGAGAARWLPERRAAITQGWLSGLEAEPAGGPSPGSGRAHPAQPLDEHGVELERLRAVDQRVEHLVVAGGAHVEQLA